MMNKKNSYCTPLNDVTNLQFLNQREVGQMDRENIKLGLLCGSAVAIPITVISTLPELHSMLPLTYSALALGEIIIKGAQTLMRR